MNPNAAVDERPQFRPEILPQVEAHLRGLGRRCFSRAQFEQLVLTTENRSRWSLDRLSVPSILDSLDQAQLVRSVALRFPARSVRRYLFAAPGPYEVAQSLGEEGYFSHYTALHFHGLTEQLPKTIYWNQEQQMAGGGGTLDQAGIDRTFRRPCRVTHNVATFDSYKLTLLNGGNTGCLGVDLRRISDDLEARVTSLERTLIDATVRPVYSGGVFEVAKAFRLGRGKVSVERLADLLRRLNYTYPYHQAIGYYLERAGYAESDLELLRAFPRSFDFYLDYALRQTEYQPVWRLHVPKGF